MGRIKRVLGEAAANAFMHAAEVIEVVDHDGGLRSIRLSGEELKGLSWTPGDKIRIHIEGTTLRTYTPTALDGEHGHLSLFTFNHGGDGPGDAWVRSACEGVHCHVLGPQRSLDLTSLTTPPVMVGDETSFALSLAWREHHETPPRAEVFEVHDRAGAQAALHDRGIDSAVLIQRQPEDGHMDELRAAVADAARGAEAICFTGKVQTIAQVRSHLKDAGISVKQSVAKAYWDIRRAGLD